MAPDLDRWLSAPAVRSAHRREACADAATLWTSALSVRLGDCRLLGRLVRTRLGVGEADTTFEELFRSAPFALLERGTGWSLSGVCGRIWSVRGELVAPADGDAFLGWREPGTARVLFAHWVTPTPGGSAIHSEVRVDAVDRRAARCLWALEPFIATFQGLVARESLSVAVRHAEGVASSRHRPGASA